MSGGSQIGNCMKSVGSPNPQKGRRDFKISVTRVTKNDIRSVKCPFRRACAVQWFGQIRELGSSVASNWHMATDYLVVGLQNLGTRRDSRGRKCFFVVYNHDLVSIWYIKCTQWWFGMSSSNHRKNSSSQHPNFSVLMTFFNIWTRKMVWM